MSALVGSVGRFILEHVDRVLDATNVYFNLFEFMLWAMNGFTENIYK